VPGFGYCPICGGVGLIICWVFITPWCGMGFCSTAGGGFAHMVVGPAEVQVVLRDMVHSQNLSSA
jgi:hypothetical protein